MCRARVTGGSSNERRDMADKPVRADKATAVAELTGGALSVNPNTMYPLLRSLEERGLVAGEWEQPDRRSRRFYRITAEGEQMFSQPWELRAFRRSAVWSSFLRVTGRPESCRNAGGLSKGLEDSGSPTELR